MFFCMHVSTEAKHLTFEGRQPAPGLLHGVNPGLLLATIFLRGEAS